MTYTVIQDYSKAVYDKQLMALRAAENELNGRFKVTPGDCPDFPEYMRVRITSEESDFSPFWDAARASVLKERARSKTGNASGS